MPRSAPESFDTDLAVLAADPTSQLHDATRAFRKAGALASNDFAGQAEVGDFAVDTTNGKAYVCTATNGTSTTTWVVVGTQT